MDSRDIGPIAGPLSFRLRTLGLPALLRDDGTLVDLPLGKPLALLAYVAMESGPITRDDLATLFWPRVTRDRGRQSVRQALLLLRRALGPDVFASDDPVRIVAGRVTVDVDEFRDALARRDIDRAAALWGGPFMDRFQLAVGHGFQSWIEEHRSSFEREYAAILDGAAAAERTAGNLKSALEHLRRAVGVARYDAGLHARCLETLLDAREFAAAETALAEARRSLGEASPGFDPEALERRLQALRAAAELQRTGAALDLEFVGRSTEMADLLAMWRLARAGQAAVAIITGPTGIGKSRLAEETASVARADGAATVFVKASEPERHIGFGIVATLARRLLKLRGAAGISGASDALLRSLVPSLSSARSPAEARPNGDSGSGIQVVALCDAMADLLGAVAEESPLVIVLDDLQWADSESLSILATLLRRSGSTACLFLLTCRPEDASPELQTFGRALEHEHIARRLHPSALSRSDVSELIGLMAAFGDAAAIDRIATRLHEVTGGNPLFLVEILRTLQEEQPLTFEGGEWRFRTDRLPSEFPLPASLRTVVDRRLERLSADGGLLAGHVARASHGETVAALKARTGLPDGAFTRAAGELIDREVLRWTDLDCLGFTHDQLRDAARRKFPVANGANRAEAARRRRRVAAILALLVIPAAALALRYALARSAAPRYGGGMLYFVAGDSVLVARPPRRGGDAWSITLPPHPLPQGIDLQNASMGPQLMPDGSRQWFDSASKPGVPPWVERVLENGERTVIARDSGDATMVSQSPDGRFVIFVRDDPSTVEYDIQMMIADGDGSHARPLRPGSGGMGGGAWSPDGSSIAISTQYHDTDSLLILTPAGDLAGAIELSLASVVGGQAWCSNDRVILTVQVADSARLAIWRRGSPGLRPVPAPPPETFDIACSPDGSAAAYRTLNAGTLQTVVADLENGSWETLPLPDGARPQAWLSDRPPVVERTVHIAAPDSLAPGDRLHLSARIVMSDRTVRDGPVHWAASDPLTVSVDSTGIVTANRPGVARIVATSTSWLTDTAEIRVVGSAATDWSYHDDLAARIVLLGASVDTRLLVRNVTLWDGQRY